MLNGFYKAIIVLNWTHLEDDFHPEGKIPRACQETLAEEIYMVSFIYFIIKTTWSECRADQDTLRQHEGPKIRPGTSFWNLKGGMHEFFKRMVLYCCIFLLLRKLGLNNYIYKRIFLWKLNFDYENIAVKYYIFDL